MPSYDQASFLGRAVRSLLDQSMRDWELIVVDDGSPDDVRGALAALGSDPRVRYVRLPENCGLGAAINTGADTSRAPLLAYLPCDDVYDEEHLAALLSVLADEQVVLAWSGVRHHAGQYSPAGPPGHGLQLVQVMHCRSSVRWQDALREVRPDVIYGQLNWRAVPFAVRVLRERAGTPFVWHFKESPHRSIHRGEWPQLAELCVDADAVVFSSPQERDWFRLALPGRLDPDRTLVIDGSLPKRDWFSGVPALRLSDEDGEVHTVVLGRPLGLDVAFLEALVAHGVHVHFHGLSDGPGPQGGWRNWLADAIEVAGGRLHVHPAVDQRGWVSTLSATMPAGCADSPVTTTGTCAGRPGTISTIPAGSAR